MSLSTDPATTWEDVLRKAMIADANKSEVMRKGGKYSLGRQDRSDGQDPRTVKLRTDILDRLTEEPQTVRQLAGSDYSAGQVQVSMRWFESESIAVRIRGGHFDDQWFLA